MTNGTTKTGTQTTNTGRVSGEQEPADDVIRMLESWRTRIDELRVQVDLATLDLRDQAAQQLDLARNVNSVAASKLRKACDDAEKNAETLRHGMLNFLHDMNEAFDAVRGVVARG